MTEIMLDGSRVNSLESFWDEVERCLIPGLSWGRNLEAFDDILRGGFGTPEGGFVLKWAHSRHSKEFLGYPETLRQLRLRLENCHSENRAALLEQISLAELEKGPTVFDWLVEVIEDHGAGGNQASDNVMLILT